MANKFVQSLTNLRQLWLQSHIKLDQLQDSVSTLFPHYYSARFGMIMPGTLLLKHINLNPGMDK